MTAHPAAKLLLVSALLLVNGWFDHYLGSSRIVSYGSWFLGGAIGVITLSAVTADCGACLGELRWVPAAGIFAGGIWVLFRFRPERPLSNTN